MKYATVSCRIHSNKKNIIKMCACVCSLNVVFHLRLKISIKIMTMIDYRHRAPGQDGHDLSTALY